jgi:hypothetical protein
MYARQDSGDSAIAAHRLDWAKMTHNGREVGASDPRTCCRSLHEWAFGVSLRSLISIKNRALWSEIINNDLKRGKSKMFFDHRITVLVLAMALLWLLGIGSQLSSLRNIERRR